MLSYIEDQSIQAKRWIILLIVGVGTALSAFTFNAILIATPNIVTDYGITGLDVAWVQTAFMLTSTCLMVLAGKLGDSFGKFKMFKLGLIILTLGLLLGGFKSSFQVLIISRVIQGIGSVLSMSINFAIAEELFKREERGKAIGIIASFLSGGGIFGPVFSGMILKSFGYHIILWLGVPVGVICYLLALKYFPKDRTATGKSIDWIGALLLAGFIACFFFGIDLAKKQGFFGPTAGPLFIVSIVALVAFVFYERRQQEPVLDLSVVSNKHMVIYLVSLLLVYTISGFNGYLMPFYLRNTLGIEPQIAGLMTVMIAITITVVSPFAGKLSDKYGAKNMILIGCGLMAISQLTYFFYGVEGNIPGLIATFILTGIGSGVFQTPNNAMILSSVPRDKIGMASGVSGLIRNLSLTAGSLVASQILFAAMSHFEGTKVDTYLPDKPGLFVQGMHVVYFVSFLFCALAFILVFIDRKISTDEKGGQKHE